MKTMPRRLLIRGKTWLITYSKRAPNWAPKGCIGGACKMSMRIWVRKTDNIENDLETLAHEIVHCMMPDISNPSTEEYITDTMEENMYSLLKDNNLSFFWERRKCV